MGVACCDQKAQHSPNTSPASLSRQYKPLIYLLVPAQNKTPATIVDDEG
jgi:hypothetical protein